MPDRRLPVRPDLVQLKHRAKDCRTRRRRLSTAAGSTSWQHRQRDPSLLHRTFSHEEIYPPELGCHDEVLATHGTPLAGATPLHMWRRL